MNPITNKVKAALNAKEWNDQLVFIQYVEELLMNDNYSIKVGEINLYFVVLSKYIINDNKNLVQRSLKIVEALCKYFIENLSQSYNLHEAIISDVFKNVYQCLNDTRPNIRIHAVNTLHLLINITGFTIFCKNTSETALSLTIDGRSEVIQIIIQHQYDMNEKEWNLIFNFLVQIYEDKVLLTKHKAQDLYFNEMFLNQLKDNIGKLDQSQKKVFQKFLENKTKLLATGNTFEDENIKLDIINDSYKEDKDKKTTNLNTSVFSRRQRLNELKDSDGLFLLTDISFFGPFMHRLALDIRNVFDDEISELLLSPQSIIRVSAADRLREIFSNSLKNFEYSVDIMIRWCIIQFLSWQLNISQASLTLLTDMLDCYQNNQSFKLTSKEVHIITPVLLWCMTTKSDAFKYLLQQIKTYSNAKDYNESLLMSLSLDHIPVITHIFDELKLSNNIEEIKGQLEELSQESTITFVKDECKKLLLKLNPLSPRNTLKMKNQVKNLQAYITMIKTNPDEIEDCRKIFGYLLDMYELKNKDTKEVRYLLYCTHAFMSEPILSCQINIEDITSLVTLLCEFSLVCSKEFIDALIAIGFAISSVHVNVEIFNTLLNFITNNLDSQNENSFSYQMFLIGIQLIAINQSSIDLQNLKMFVHNVIGRFPSINDIRAKLCRKLIAEMLIIKKNMLDDAYLMKDIENGSLIQFRRNNILKTRILNDSESDSVRNCPIKVKDDQNDDLFEFIRIMKRIMKIETRYQSIKELINFDKKFPNKKILDTVINLSPLLRKDIEEMKQQSNANSRCSSRLSNREDCSKKNLKISNEKKSIISTSSQRFQLQGNLIKDKISSSSSSIIKQVLDASLKKHNLRNMNRND